MTGFDLASRIRAYQDRVGYDPARHPANLAFLALHELRGYDREAYDELIRLIDQDPEKALEAWVRQPGLHRNAERMVLGATQGD
ncbi:MAG: hypothetical protein IT203_05235 [Fimbriimonadaceae bacterium]|nr:hypothetical protein [Fimbriimonadaceae bacterium]